MKASYLERLEATRDGLLHQLRVRGWRPFAELTSKERSWQRDKVLGANVLARIDELHRVERLIERTRSQAA